MMQWKWNGNDAINFIESNSLFNNIDLISDISNIDQTKRTFQQNKTPTT